MKFKGIISDFGLCWWWKFKKQKCKYYKENTGLLVTSQKVGLAVRKQHNYVCMSGKSTNTSKHHSRRNKDKIKSGECLSLANAYHWVWNPAFPLLKFLLIITNLMHFFMYLFISSLYMFRASSAHHYEIELYQYNQVLIIRSVFFHIHLH